jgi:hypothetical protein
MGRLNQPEGWWGVGAPKVVSEARSDIKDRGAVGLKWERRVARIISALYGKWPPRSLL